MNNRIIILGSLSEDFRINLEKLPSFHKESTKSNEDKLIPNYNEIGHMEYLGASARTARLLSQYPYSVTLATIIDKKREPEILDLLKQCKVDTRLIQSCTHQKNLQHKCYFLDNKPHFILRSPVVEATHKQTQALVNQFKHELHHYAAAIISPGLMHQSLKPFIEDLKHCIQNHPKVFIEPFKLSHSLSKNFLTGRAELEIYRGAYCFKPNRKEAEHLLNLKLDSYESQSQALIRLRQDYQINHPIITLDRDGVIFLDQKDQLVHLPSTVASVKNVWGNGEVFLTTLVALNLKGFLIHNETIQKVMDNCQYFTTQQPEKIIPWRDLIHATNHNSTLQTNKDP